MSTPTQPKTIVKIHMFTTRNETPAGEQYYIARLSRWIGPPKNQKVPETITELFQRTNSTLYRWEKAAEAGKRQRNPIDYYRKTERLKIDNMPLPIRYLHYIPSRRYREKHGLVDFYAEFLAKTKSEDVRSAKKLNDALKVAKYPPSCYATIETATGRPAFDSATMTSEIEELEGDDTESEGESDLAEEMRGMNNVEGGDDQEREEVNEQEGIEYGSGRDDNLDNEDGDTPVVSAGEKSLIPKQHPKSAKSSASATQGKSSTTKPGSSTTQRKEPNANSKSKGSTLTAQMSREAKATKDSMHGVDNNDYTGAGFELRDSGSARPGRRENNNTGVSDREVASADADDEEIEAARYNYGDDDSEKEDDGYDN